MSEETRLDYFRDLLKVPINPRTGKRLGETQRSFMQDRCRFKWWSGNRGGGKTASLCWLTAWLAMSVRNNRILLGRKYYEELHTTLMQTWNDWIKPDVFNIEYEGGKKPKRAIFRDTGSEVWFVGFDRDARWLGNEIGAFAIDQAEQLDQEKFLTLQANLRWRHTPESMMYGLAVGNPRGHFWAWKKFNLKRGMPPEDAAEYRWYKNTPLENVQNLKGQERYYQRIKASYPPYLAARYLEGSDDAAEGLALSSWDSREGLGNVREFEPSEYWTPYIIYDHGFFPSPAVFLLAWQDDETGTVYVEDELALMRHGVDELLEALHEKAESLKFPLGRCDNKIADPQVRAQKNADGKPVWEDFNERGFTFTNAQKGMKLSLQRTNGRLAVQAMTKMPGLIVHPRCSGLIEAAEEVMVDEKKPGREELIGEGVDYIDTLRYLVMGVRQTPIIPVYQDPVAGTWREVEERGTFTVVNPLQLPASQFPIPPAWWGGQPPTR